MSPLPLHAYPSRTYAERRIGSGPPLAAALSRVVARTSEHTRSGPLVWRFAREGMEPRRVELDGPGIAELLAEREPGPGGAWGLPFILADAPDVWRVLFNFSVNAVEGIEYLSISMPGARDPQLTDLTGVMRLVGDVATEFGAHTAFVEDGALRSLYQGRRVVEIMRAKAPPVLRDRIAEPTPVPGAAGELPELLLPTEFDRARVPQAVFWINHWSAAQVDTLGRDRVAGAGWERVLPAEGGGLTLAAAAAPPDVTRASDLERLRGIVVHLGLRAAQERHSAV